MSISFLAVCSLFLSALGHFTDAHSSCKPLPGDAEWPTEIQWRSLNQSVSGRLQTPVPFGAVCHSNSTSYNNASCATLRTDWLSSGWQESNGWTSMYNDDTCLPSSEAPCSTKGYPAYVIEARTIGDVQAGIRFASSTGVRLIVKGTGHDEPGRSAGSRSLSIWTHHLRGVDITKFNSSGTGDGAVASVKLGAGMVWGDVYEQMANADLTIVGGADPHVGVGGLTQGGGHGPLTSRYGLAADQVLAMEVVTADGAYRCINATSHADLFWAMRGGGPSTFAVMLSMTVKAYPKLAGYQYRFSYNTTANSDTFWNLVANFSSRLPMLNEQGVMGYYYPVPDSGLANRSISGTLAGSLLFPNKTKAQVEGIVDSLETSLHSPSWAEDPIYIGSDTVVFENFMAYWHRTNAPESVGTDVRYVSWLLDIKALTNVSNLANTLRAVTTPTSTWVGHFVAGKAVADARPPGGAAILPAWRSAYVHLLQVRAWTPLNSTAKNLETTAMRNNVQPALRSLAPNSGSYMNEADPSNPNWKEEYFGENYEKLLRIKNIWDPKGVFWCKPCIGYDEWDIISLDNPSSNIYERGIGQDYIRLCRKAVQML